MPKVTFGIIVFQGDHFLEEALISVRHFGPVVVAEGPVKFWQDQGYRTSTDRTNEILDWYSTSKGFAAEYLIKVVHGPWAEKDEQSNAYMPLVPEDTEFLWMVDADEILSPELIEKTFKLLDTGQYDSIAFRPYSFYGGFARYVSGFDENFEWVRIQRWYPGARWATHRPPTILAPDGQPWKTHRHLNQFASEEMLGRFHHYSYVYPSQVKMKMKYYASRAPGGIIPDYFKQVYLPWARGDNAQRILVETLNEGVHEWIPERRGPSYTKPFEGAHPLAVHLVMSRLQARLEQELAEYGQAT